jgi:hypothetical protein
LDVHVDSLRVCQILEHDFADLEGGFTEAELEDLDGSDLSMTYEQSIKTKKKSTWSAIDARQGWKEEKTDLLLEIVLLDGEQLLGEQDL